MTCALLAVASLLSWEWTLKPALYFLLAMSAAGSYFMWTYHVVIDSEMLVHVLQTDRSEAVALLEYPDAGVLAVALHPARSRGGLVPLCACAVHWDRRREMRQQGCSRSWRSPW